MAVKLTKKNTKVQKVVKKARPAQSRAQTAKPAAQPHTFAIPKVTYTEAIGRRKTAIARVRLYPGQGDFVVNNQVVGKYFEGVINAPAQYNLPFTATETLGDFAVTVTVSGSGMTGQLGAVVHGLARALVAFDEKNRLPLKTLGLLTRDDRMKETRKIGMGGKARRQRQSPKR